MPWNLLSISLFSIEKGPNSPSFLQVACLFFFMLPYWSLLVGCQALFEVQIASLARFLFVMM